MSNARERTSWTSDQPRLTDGTITLRPWESSDAGWVFDACQDPEIQRWTRVPVPYDHSDAEGFVSRFTADNWANQRGAHFAVVDTESGRGLGSVGVQAHDLASGVGEAGYWTAPEARGQGSTSRALGLLIDWAFAHGGFVRLELLIEDTNAKSKAVAERVGFACEGLLKKKVWKYGAHRDVALYAKTV